MLYNGPFIFSAYGRNKVNVNEYHSSDIMYEGYRLTFDMLSSYS